MWQRLLNRLALAPLLAASLAGAALPPTAPGAFDPTFGTGGSGQVVADYGSNYDYGQHVIIQPDGKYLIAGYGSNLGANIGIGFVARHNHDGSADTGFNGTGRRLFGDDSVGQSVAQALLQPDGKIIVVGYSYLPTSPSDGIVRGVITRLNADGSIDAGFGNAGVVQLSGTALPWLYLRSAALRADGRILVAGTETNTATQETRPFTMGFLAGGQPDPAYGGGGQVWFTALANGMRPNRTRLHASGKATLAGFVQVPGSSPAAYRACIVRLGLDGAPDTTFAAGGKYIYESPGLDNQFEDLALDADGTLLAVGEAWGSSRVAFALRLDAAGQPDAAFGAQGVTTFPATVALAQGVAVQPDRRIVIAGSRLVNGDFQALALRLLPDGRFDTGFGTGGVTTQDFGYTRSYGWGVAVDADGKVVMTGIAKPATSSDNTLLARLIGTEITTPVIEFHNTQLNHYFITADPNEAAAIDGGAAGPGWTRTGEAFKSGGPNRVCRFYGSPDIDPVSGTRRGPNSHVYTIDADECAAIRMDAGWRFESYDFNGWNVPAGGICPAGTIAVKRAYNRRFAENDSNHRYTTSNAIYDQMVASGWAGEGTVFCAAV